AGSRAAGRNDRRAFCRRREPPQPRRDDGHDDGQTATCDQEGYRERFGWQEDRGLIERTTEQDHGQASRSHEGCGRPWWARWTWRPERPERERPRKCQAAAAARRGLAVERAPAPRAARRRGNHCR